VCDVSKSVKGNIKQAYGPLLTVPPLTLFESKENVGNGTPTLVMC